MVPIFMFDHGNRDAMPKREHIHSAPIIRLATDLDLEALSALEKASFAKPWTKSQLYSLVKAYEPDDMAQEFALVLEGPTAFETNNANIFAYIAWQKVLDEATLLSIAVHPTCRQKGFAKKLFMASEEILRQAKIQRILLEVSENNVVAQKFYEKLGFIKDGERANYYGKGEAAWLMSRILV